jgi:hypothetical protein
MVKQHTNEDTHMNAQVKQSGHTPGPWEIHDGGRFGSWGNSGPSVCAVTGKNLCQPLVEFVGPDDLGQCAANARLIAAAPDLLEALNALVNGTGAWTMLIDNARAALAKAGV